jgi:hypothetical protein
MMALVPPVGWADVATKSYLDHLHDVLGLRIDALGSDLRAEISNVRADFHRDLRESQRNFIFAMLAAMTTQTAIILTVLFRLL